jgi:hypothetical protein
MSESTEWLPIIERAAQIIGSDHRNPGVVLAALEWQAKRIQYLENLVEILHAEQHDAENALYEIGEYD